jgi:uncharacterized RDD family membrane protein YckC
VSERIGVTAPGGHAGVVTRSLAAAVDTAVVAVAVVLVYLGTVAVRFALMPLAFTWPRPSPAFSVVGVAVVATAYLAASWATTGRTYGSGLLGLRVLSARRGLLGWPRATVRAVACVVFPVGLLWAAISPSRRSLQDLILRSVVVYDWHRDRGKRAMAPEAALR